MGLSRVSVPSDWVSAAAESPDSFFITLKESVRPSSGTAIPIKALKVTAEIDAVVTAILFSTVEGMFTIFALNSLRPPSVQEIWPVVEGMTSCACTGAASTASNRVASLARGGRGGGH